MKTTRPSRPHPFVDGNQQVTGGKPINLVEIAKTGILNLVEIAKNIHLNLVGADKITYLPVYMTMFL